MTEQMMDVEAYTIWDLFPLSGEIAITLFFISIVILTTGVYLAIAVKPKRNLGIWLIDSIVKFSATSALLSLCMGFVVMAMKFHGSIIDLDKCIHFTLEVFIGPMFLFIVTWVAVIASFLLQIKDKFANQGMDLTR